MKIRKIIVKFLDKQAESETKMQCSHGRISAGIGKKRPAHLQNKNK